MYNTLGEKSSYFSCSAIIRQHPIIIITTTEYVKVTNHCGVQVRGNIEDFVQTHGRVDALVLFASTNEDKYKKTNTHRNIRKGK